MEYRVLGTLEVRDNGRSLPLAGAKQRALLALLLVHANRVLSRDRLIDELWGNEPPETAVQSLQVYVSRLRKLLPPETLLTRPPGYLLEIEPGELDLQRFERLLADGREALAHGEPERASDVLREALALWRGSALAEFVFEPFARAESGRLEELRLAAVEERIEADLALGRHPDLIGELEALVVDNPYRERLRGQLMLALYRSGRQAEALEAYQRMRDALVGELGVEPTLALRDLHREILAQGSGLAVPAQSPASERTNLPAPPNRFVGRTRELSEVCAELSREGLRLLTLTGPGGSGKTRLALQVAADASDQFEDGVFWVSLAAVRDPDLVLPAVAAAIGVDGDLAARVGTRRMLLLLDNLEQVIECAPQLAEVIQATPNLKLLVTSRQPLRIAAEREYEVLPLIEDEAVELFLERAHECEPLDAARAICRRLDSLPLAIELAAARTKLVPPTELLERLERALPMLTGGARDAPERQRTLLATIEWSYELLDPVEQRLFRRLAVFAGGFDLDAAEAVAEADVDTLGSLLDKSLVRRRAGTVRYFLFETIREFAFERLKESDESDRLALRHAEHFLALAEGIGGSSFEGDEARGVARLAEETANFRVAIDCALDQDRVDLVCRFGPALLDFWLLRGHTREGRRWLEWAVARGDPAADEWVLAVVALSEIARFQGATNRARELKEEAVRVLAARGEKHLRATVLADLADLEMERGALGTARDLLDASLALRSPDLVQGIARTLSSFATLAVHENELERADALLKEAFDLHSDFDAESDFVGGALERRAEVARRRGEAAEAELLFGQALRIFHAFRDPAQIADCLEGLAALAAAGGQMERAGRLVGAAQTLRSDSEIPGIWPERVPRDTPAEAQRSGERMDLDEAVEYALSTVD